MLRTPAGVGNRLAADFQLPQSGTTPTAPALTREGSVRSNNTSIVLNLSREVTPEVLASNTTAAQPSPERPSFFQRLRRRTRTNYAALAGVRPRTRRQQAQARQRAAIRQQENVEDEIELEEGGPPQEPFLNPYPQDI